MTDKQRAEMRTVQDRFLAHPAIKNEIEKKGWDARIAWHDSPSFADLRDTLAPKWVPWLVDFLNENK